MAKNIIYTILIVLTSMCGRALAECKTVRLDQQDGPFEKIPVYDQEKFSMEDQNICYAVAASQLLDADRFYNGDHELKQLSSPLSIALNYKVKNDNSKQQATAAGLLGGGEIAPALDASFDHPLCNQRSLEKYSSLIGTRERNPLPKKFFRSLSVSSTDNFLQAILDQAQKSRDLEQRLSNNDKVEYPAECELNLFFRSRALSRENLADIQRIMHESLKQSNFLLLTSKVLEELCQKDSFVVPKKKIEFSNGGTPFNKEEHDRCYSRASEVLDKMPNKTPSDYVRELGKCNTSLANPNKMQAQAHNLLEAANPIPVGIAYNPEALKKTKGEGFAKHASVIIGQQFNPSTKSCDFLVRDSYGPSCDESKKDYKYPCENGGVWVPENVLFSAARYLTWIPR